MLLDFGVSLQRIRLTVHLFESNLSRGNTPDVWFIPSHGTMSHRLFKEVGTFLVDETCLQITDGITALINLQKYQNKLRKPLSAE